MRNQRRGSKRNELDAAMTACPTCGRSCEPWVPLCCSCLVRCHPGVRWRASGSTKTALTIDDFPSANMDTGEFALLRTMLQSANNGDGVCVTFFVIWDKVKTDPDLYYKQITELVRDGHEIAVHYKGRWGWSRPTESYLAELVEFEQFCSRQNIPLRFVRPPGGFATHSFVDRHFKAHSLITVIGTAYPFDADLCRCMSPAWIGKCASTLSAGGGRIVILHAGATLRDKLCAFLKHSKGQKIDTLARTIDDAASSDLAARMLLPP